MSLYIIMIQKYVYIFKIYLIQYKDKGILELKFNWMYNNVLFNVSTYR